MTLFAHSSAADARLVRGMMRIGEGDCGGDESVKGKEGCACRRIDRMDNKLAKAKKV